MDTQVPSMQTFTLLRLTFVESDEKTRDISESDGSYTIDLSRCRPQMVFLKMKRHVNSALQAVEKMTENLKKLTTAVNTLQHRVDEPTEMQVIVTTLLYNFSVLSDTSGFVPLF